MINPCLDKQTSFLGKVKHTIKIQKVSSICTVSQNIMAMKNNHTSLPQVFSIRRFVLVCIHYSIVQKICKFWEYLSQKKLSRDLNVVGMNVKKERSTLSMNTS